MFLHGWSWGSAALHPRLYAVTRSAGLRISLGTANCRMPIREFGFACENGTSSPRTAKLTGHFLRDFSKYRHSFAVALLKVRTLAVVGAAAVALSPGYRLVARRLNRELSRSFEFILTTPEGH
jgi:hypothetical protein